MQAKLFLIDSLVQCML